MPASLRRIYCLLLIPVAVLTACHEAANPLECDTEIDSYTSPAPGVLTLTGTFTPDETVFLSYKVNGQDVQQHITPATARTQITFIGLPSGTANYGTAYSCQGDQSDPVTHSYTIQ